MHMPMVLEIKLEGAPTLYRQEMYPPTHSHSACRLPTTFSTHTLNEFAHASWPPPGVWEGEQEELGEADGLCGPMEGDGLPVGLTEKVRWGLEEGLVVDDTVGLPLADEYADGVAEAEGDDTTSAEELTLPLAEGVADGQGVAEVVPVADAVSDWPTWGAGPVLPPTMPPRNTPAGPLAWSARDTVCGACPEPLAGLEAPEAPALPLEPVLTTPSAKLPTTTATKRRV